MDVSLAQLRTLAELSHLKTMAAVAASLGYTHGAISQQLATLERAVGFKLTTKNGGRVSLTDAGAILAQYAEKILETVGDAEAALEGTREAAMGPVRLGTFATTAAGLLSSAIATATTRFPGLSIASVEVDVDDASAAVRRGDVDVAFGLDYSNAPIPREDGIDNVLLRTERFDLAVPPGFLAERGVALRHGERLELGRAAEWDWILPPARSHYGGALRVACRLAGFEPRVLHEVTDTAASLTMVARGLGVAPATTMMLQLVPALELEAVPLVQDIHRDVILARRRDRRRSVDALVQILHEVVEEYAAPPRLPAMQ